MAGRNRLDDMKLIRSLILCCLPVLAMSQEPQPDLDRAMALIFEGRGGEDGIGMSKLWPRLTIPALTSEQITKIVTGNTVRNNESIALYFDPEGTVDSWYVDWAKDESARCPQPEVKDDGFQIRDGVCHRKTVVPVAGKWQVRENKLCSSLAWLSEKRDQCWNVALVLDQVVLFSDAGEILGRGKQLRRGRALDQVVE